MTAQAGATTFSEAAADKAVLRKALRQRRAALSSSERRHAAAQAARHLIRFLSRQRARRVALYIEYGSELSTLPLRQQLPRHGIRIALPKLRGSHMRFIEWAPHASLRRNGFGIAEPSGRRQWAPSSIDVIVMPLTGFDDRGHRLGTGGGYYDRCLEHVEHRHRPLRIGYAFAAQHCESLPREPWDITLHAICTERGLRCFKR